MIDSKVIEIVPAIRMFASEETIKVAGVVSNKETEAISCVNCFGGYADKFATAPLFIDGGVEEVKAAIASYISDNSKAPSRIVVKGLGLIAVADSAAEVEALLATKKDVATVAAASGRMAGKIAIVTGGAQGFGGGIVEYLIKEGANVIIADLNEAKGSEYAAELNAGGQSNKAAFVKVDVSDLASVENLVKETVCTFGGLDIFISNAGVLRAGGLEEMDDKTFDFMTKVNYSGYFYCSKAASKVMKVQTANKPGYYCDIIQINSKSGLKGSNKNFAYAGGKFGGIGLTQSFAMELMPNRIKVNSICPGNFFDGPLWSDPEKGLFVQYLNAGKVKGAKTIEDVKAFYEAQVPAGRGCEPLDVMRAIYYVVEQEYETGQAVPVTGGQNMLN